jgi:hypothetical protein
MGQIGVGTNMGFSLRTALVHTLKKVIGLNSLAIAPSGAILLGANVVWDLVNAGMLPLLLSFPQKNCGERKTPRVEDHTGPPGEKDCLNHVLIIYWLCLADFPKRKGCPSHT